MGLMSVKVYMLFSFYMLAMLSITNHCFAQEVGDEVVVVVGNGEEYQGFLQKKTENAVTIIDRNGITIKIPADRVIFLTNSFNWRAINPMPNYSTYFFANSAKMLKKKELVYTNSYFVLNGINYGLTDHLSIGGGVEIFSTLANNVPALGYFRAKIGKEFAKNFQLSTGFILFGSSGFDETIHLAFTNATYGSNEHHITFGMGYNFNELGGVALNLSYLNRFRKKAALVSENWLLSTDSDVNFISYGLRFFGDDFSFDAAFWNNTEVAREFLLGVPYLGFQIKIR